MSKRRQDSWPTWKIIAGIVLTIVAGSALLWASQAVQSESPAATQPAPTDGPTSPYRDAPMSGPGTLLFLLALISWATGAVFAGWLIYRWYMRIPAWRRRQLFGRGR